MEKIKISNEKYYDEQINENSLVNLNHAFIKKRLKIEVLSGYKANKPLIIYSNVSDKSKSSIINSNIELVLGEDSSLEL
jgi:Fe-S cluster assembly protein SufD